MPNLFSVELTFTDGTQRVVGYGSIMACLEDPSLRALFDGDLLRACEINCGAERIAGLPIVAWDRLVDQIVSNATAILRRRYSNDH